MTHKQIFLKTFRTTTYCVITLLITTFFLSSCGVNKSMLSQENNNYPGTIVLTNGERKTGQIGMPRPGDKSVLFIGSENGKNTETYIEPENIDRIEIGAGSSDKVHVVRRMPIRGMFNSVSDRWVLCIAEGPYVSAYIGAEGYTINYDGTISLAGTRQVLQTGASTAIINPSFPVYLIKQGDKALVNVALKDGVSFEGSAFRAGVSRYLADDPKLGEYIRSEKWDFNNLGIIVRNYNPARGNGELLAIDGVTVEPTKRGIFTNALDKEMLFYVESTIPSDDTYGTQFAIGLRTSAFKFLSYGADIGYASAKYIDESKRFENHPINSLPDAFVIDDDLSKQGLFRFNTFLGGQLPFDLKKVYLIPAAHISFGGMLGNEYSTLNYGPMMTLDVGLKLKHGDILLIGGGYRRNIPLKGDEGKEEASAPGFEAYKPYNNILIRLAYKF